MIPKTVNHISEWYTFDEKDLPFSIDQDLNTNGIWHHISFNGNEFEDEARIQTVAIFRVYQKGQNPLSLKRQQGKWMLGQPLK